MSGSEHSPSDRKPSVPKGYEHLLEPIPQPVVHERDTDTAWAEFDSLMIEEPADDAPPPPDFEETQPFDRDVLK